MCLLRCFEPFTHSAEQNWTSRTRVRSVKTIHTSAGQCSPLLLSFLYWLQYMYDTKMYLLMLFCFFGMMQLTLHNPDNFTCTVACGWKRRNHINDWLSSIHNISLRRWFYIFCFSKLRENKKTAELIKTANLLFNSFEPYYMWDYIARWFEECCRCVELSAIKGAIVPCAGAHQFENKHKYGFVLGGQWTAALMDQGMLGV